MHTPSTLTAQETYKSTRAAAVKKKVELEDSVSQLFLKQDFTIFHPHKLKLITNYLQPQVKVVFHQYKLLRKIQQDQLL